MDLTNQRKVDVVKSPSETTVYTPAVPKEISQTNKRKLEYMAIQKERMSKGNNEPLNSDKTEDNSEDEGISLRK